ASSSTIWSNAVRWIESNGGYVHPQLRYDESLRQVYLGHHNSDTTASLSPSSSASLTNGDSSMVIEAGVTLLRIPDACLVSLHSAEKDEQFGRSLFAIVSNSSSTSTQSGSGYPSQKKKKAKSLYHDDQDVVLALFLAHLQQLRQKQSISFYNPYLDTLPSFLHGASDNSNNDESNVDNKKEGEESSSQHQLLPRQWSLETLKRRLHGTSLYQRIINERNGVRDEYELIKTAWMQQQQTEQASAPTTSFPTLEQYDTMMGAVTSRGFEGLGYDGVDVMIPLLDLLNHYRGRDSSNSEFARVRYERYNMNECNEKKKDGVVEVADGDEGEGVSPPPTKRIKTSLSSSVGGGVKVTTAQRISLPANATIPLQMTYGAKSNSTLLGRYGFCIENNVEPDGSCNDVIEIQLQTGSPPVKLQRGPKSYTYGCLIKALQLFGDDEQSLPCGDGGDGREEKQLQQESGNDDADREGV
ncbi:hypothetical protein ACHAWC_001125, partial [Mediolabrus comicus]